MSFNSKMLPSPDVLEFISGTLKQMLSCRWRDANLLADLQDGDDSSGLVEPVPATSELQTPCRKAGTPLEETPDKEFEGTLEEKVAAAAEKETIEDEDTIPATQEEISEYLQKHCAEEGHKTRTNSSMWEDAQRHRWSILPSEGKPRVVVTIDSDDESLAPSPHVNLRLACLLINSRLLRVLITSGPRVPGRRRGGHAWKRSASAGACVESESAFHGGCFHGLTQLVCL